MQEVIGSTPIFSTEGVNEDKKPDQETGRAFCLGLGRLRGVRPCILHDFGHQTTSGIKRLRALNDFVN